MIEITDITPNTVLVDGRVVRRRPGRSALEWLEFWETVQHLKPFNEEDHKKALMNEYNTGYDNGLEDAERRHEELMGEITHLRDLLEASDNALEDSHA
jgi:hypothetical protein